MPIYNKAEIGLKASELGFQRDTFEKVLRLKNVLAYFQKEEVLRKHFVLKGGTAINLTIFSMPRLSVDIDMDYFPNDSKEKMLENRQIITRLVTDYMNSEGYLLSGGSRYSHSLDAFHFQYQNAGGSRDMIKIELNYSLRSHVLRTAYRNLLTDKLGTKTAIHTVNPIEIFAAKINALLNRAAARDLYDLNNLIKERMFENEEEKELLRKTVIFYASITAKTVNTNFDTIAIDNLSFARIKRDLFPVLSSMETRKHFDIDNNKKTAKEFINNLMVLKDNEKEYINYFCRGEYKPELLFDNPNIIENIITHPMAIWRCRTKNSI